MKKLVYVLTIGLLATSAFAADGAISAGAATEVPAADGMLNSQQMEQDLQQLTWKQFRSVIESVPKMKADVEVYGPLGWQYVQSNYKTYGWKKSIDRLDDNQKQQLADLIKTAKSTK